MSSAVLCAVTLLACALTFSAAQMSCKGRCGTEYYRGFMCQCDYGCLSYGECCQDYESQCTTENSCKGRCGEAFKRGRRCSCDPDCVKFKQCCSDFKMHCDEEEPTLNEATEQDSAFSEGNNADDHLIPLVSPTTYAQDELSDDVYGQIFPNGVEDPEASPIPESTSGYGSYTAELDQIPAEPTQASDTVDFSKDTTLSDNETTQATDSSSTPFPTPGEALDGGTDADDQTSTSDLGTTPPQPTTAADGVSSQPTLMSVTQAGHSSTASDPEIEMVGQEEKQPEGDIVPEAQSTDPNVASSDVPKATVTNPSVTSASTLGSSTVLENSQEATTPASSMQNPTPIPEATTANPPLPDLKDPSISEGSGNLQEPNALTTHIPRSTDAVTDDTTDGVPPEATTADPLNVTPGPTKPTSSEATPKPQNKPKPPPAKPAPTKPSSKPETKPLDTSQTLNIDDPRDYQADDSNDTNLCSGRPVGAVTTLRNGTIVVFRGHYFWFLDRNMVPGPARGITQVWGVPSPIDTVFTRCSCQGKTYILKGTQYWRFENDVLDPGYPKVIETGFDGLRGHITAALSVPQYQRRRESVYFFKRGGSVQKYSYQFGTTPTCGRKPQYAVYTVRNRMARQAESPLGPVINIRRAWRGFPSTITAAVSIPSNREPEGYKYYVFSRSKSYNVRMDGERPVIAAPTASASPQSNNFFKCPKKV
uniref:proteoglycan 4b isoform X2 n=1 Tax=Scatophagus argus TaxID=75038 RepID=UPI001ED83E26|nr:proteoglycan 4b isoform X2 [Scatophagus argus]